MSPQDRRPHITEIWLVPPGPIFRIRRGGRDRLQGGGPPFAELRVAQTATGSPQEVPQDFSRLLRKQVRPGWDIYAMLSQIRCGIAQGLAQQDRW